MSTELGSASFNLTVKSIWNLEGKEQTVPTQLLVISSGDNIQPLVKSCESEMEMKTFLDSQRQKSTANE